MDYKEKYEQALEVAQRFYNNSVAITKKGLEDIFPELKESIDERIKKVIKQVLSESTTEKDECYLDNGVTQQEVFAWLEAQGEHANFRNKIQIGDKVTRNKDGVLVNLSQLNRVAKKDEKQGEQPKKHDVCDNCDQQGCCVSPCPMKLVEKHGEHKDVEPTPIFRVGDTIKKKGKDYTFIVDRIQGGYYHCDRNHGAFFPIEEQDHWELVGLKPAWSEEDEKMLKDTIRFCELCGNQVSANWLKSLRPQNTWRPSDEQMKLLREVQQALLGKDCHNRFVNFMCELKKLKEE